MSADSPTLEAPFERRQKLTIQIALILSFVTNLFFLIFAIVTHNGKGILNAVYIICSCLPTYSLLKIKNIEAAKHFVYYPAIFTIAAIVYWDLNSELFRGNLENTLVPYVVVSIVFFEGISRIIGIGLNLVLVVILKYMRYYGLNLSDFEIYEDIAVVGVTYIAILSLGHLYRLDVLALTEKNEKIYAQKQIIEEQAVSLRKTNDVKDRLFSIIAHDLRSPIVSLQGILQLTESSTINQENFKILLKRLSENVGQLHLMLDNLLVWSFSQIKNIRPEATKFNLKLVLSEVFFLYTETAKQKNISLINNFTFDTTCLGDEQQMKIVFRNLVNNAIKFSRNGGKVEINAYKDNKFISIKVKDNGTGIKSEDLETIFSKPKFTTGTKGEAGTGLGLHLCYEIVSNLNGMIYIDSKFGYGTTVEVKLPIET